MKGFLYAFIGGAVVGATLAILFAPEKGEDLRLRIVNYLKSKGIDFTDAEVDELLEQINTEKKE